MTTTIREWRRPMWERRVSLSPTAGGAPDFRGEELWAMMASCSTTPSRPTLLSKSGLRAAKITLSGYQVDSA